MKCFSSRYLGAGIALVLCLMLAICGCTLSSGDQTPSSEPPVLAEESSQPASSENPDLAETAYESYEIGSDLCRKIRVNNRVGLIDVTSGQVIAEPIYVTIDNFSEGLAVSRNETEYHYLDERGNVVLTFPIEGYDYGSFENGLADMTAFHYNEVDSNLDYKTFGFIDKSGEVVIPPIYSGVIRLRTNNTIIVVTGLPNDYKYGVVSVTGEVLVEPVYENIHIDNRETDVPIMAKKDGLWGVIDEYGEPVSGFLFEDFMPFSGAEITPARRDGKYGYINRSGEFVIEPQYDMASPFGTSEYTVVCPVYMELLPLADMYLESDGRQRDYYDLTNHGATMDIYIFNSCVINTQGEVLYRQEELLKLNGYRYPRNYDDVDVPGFKFSLYAPGGQVFSNVGAAPKEWFQFDQYVLNKYSYDQICAPLNGTLNEHFQFQGLTYIPQPVEVHVFDKDIIEVSNVNAFVKSLPEKEA